MKSRVVITSIYSPGKAVKEIAGQGYSLIVVGDKKTPDDWNHAGVKYIGVREQENLEYDLINKLPYNHYGRKMIGYLEAMKEGAEYIIDTDDDNIPYPNWKFPFFEGKYEKTSKDLGFINIYSSFSNKHIWPRGLPLDRIDSSLDKLLVEKSNIGVWQALADGDPDVDAIYRLVDNEPCNFERKQPVVLGRGTLSPFNSQNTAFRKELFALLYLPAFVNFRFTDILRGWVAQPIMWAAGYELGFIGATVVQERNPHDYMKDFESEIPCYLYGDKVVDVVNSVINTQNSVADNLIAAYESLQKEEIVNRDELHLLSAWLNDVKKLNR